MAAYSASGYDREIPLSPLPPVSPSYPRLLLSASCLLLSCLALLAARAEAGEAPENDKLIRIKVRLALTAAAELSPKALKFAVFPSGRRCAFTYTGPRDPRTIGFLTKLGFRTTVYVGPDTGRDYIKALEDEGAEVGIGGYPGAVGGYASLIEGNAVQGAFDAVARSVRTLRAKCGGPLACGTVDGHIGMDSFPINRDMDSAVGYGAVFGDSNLMLLLDNKPYAIYTAHDRDAKMLLRDKNDNVVPTQNVPNELIYYQILAGQFQGTLRSVQKGHIIRYSLRDFKAADLEEMADVIGEYGKHPLVWHATEGEIGGYEYGRRKTRILSATPKGSEIEITLGVDRDTFPRFLLAPLTLELPKGVSVKSASAGELPCALAEAEGQSYVDVPLRAALEDGCKMSLATAYPDMTVPDEMPVTLTIRNTSGKAMEDVRLEWAGSPGLNGSTGLAISGGTDSPFRLEANSERQVTALARTLRGARWGLSTVQAVLTAKVAGEERSWLGGFEIAGAPRLAVEMDPMSRLSIPPGRFQHFQVHISNQKGKFVNHKAGPCKGTISFELPEGLEAEPREQAFDLQMESRQSLLFKVKNGTWGIGLVNIKPVVKFEGEKEPMEVACPGTTVCREQAIVEVKPLDDKGLLVCASYDDNTRSGSFDRCAGSGGAYKYPGHSATYSPEGVKGWCIESGRSSGPGSCEIYDPFKNIDSQAGTVLFWMRRDPKVRNELQVQGDPAQSWKQGCGRSNNGETVFTAGMVQRRAYSQGGLSMRRFPSWEGKEGYLEAVYQGLGGQLNHVHVPYEKDKQFEWRHVALLWSSKERRLEIYLDGELKGKAESGPAEWFAVPWDKAGQHSGWNLQIITNDHGAWAGTCRDEVYIYNRALSAEEIKANMEQIKKK